MKIKIILFPLLISTIYSCSNKSNSQEQIENKSSHTVNLNDKLKSVSIQYLKDNLPDFKSYEDISWSKIDTLYQTESGTKDNDRLDSIENLLRKYDSEQLRFYIEDMVKDRERTLEYLKSLKSLSNEKIDRIQHEMDLTQTVLDSLNKILPVYVEKESKLRDEKVKLTQDSNKKGMVVTGYSINHRYRSKDVYGVMNVFEMSFLIDTNYKVYRVVDVGKLKRDFNVQ